jgi:hypothetical protein
MMVNIFNQNVDFILKKIILLPHVQGSSKILKKIILLPHVQRSSRILKKIIMLPHVQGSDFLLTYSFHGSCVLSPNRTFRFVGGQKFYIVSFKSRDASRQDHGVSFSECRQEVHDSSYILEREHTGTVNSTPGLCFNRLDSTTGVGVNDLL